MTAATLIKKVSNEFSKRESQADQILFELASEGRSITSDERRFLMSVGRLDQTGYAGDQELRSLVHRAQTVLELRAAAGLNGEFESAVAHAEQESLDSDFVQKEMASIDNEMRSLQARRQLFIDADQKARRKVDAMKTAREQLRSTRFLPSVVSDDFQSASRAVASNEQTELADAEAELHEARLAIEFDADIANGSDRTNRHSQRINDVLSFATRFGCTDSFVDSGKMIRCTINTENWSKFVSTKRQQLPELQERIVELKERYDAAKDSADEILDFWLNENPWSTRQLMDVVLGT